MSKWLLIAWAFAGLARAQITLTENAGFCSGGAFVPAHFQTFGSYCTQGDASVGRAVTNTFRLTGAFEIYLAGYPFANGLTLRLENVSDHQTLDIRPPVPPGEAWHKFQFELPDGWRGKDLRIVAEDQSTAIGGWLAFSSPANAGNHESFVAAKRVLVKTVLFTLLLYLPGFTLGAFAISRRVRGQIKLGLVILSGIPLPGYFIFWVYLFAPKWGYLLSKMLPYVFGAALLVLLFRLPARDRKRLLPFLIPLALTFFASLGIISLGYTYGDVDHANATARSRFSHDLPPDNEIPYLFAEGLRKGAVPKPLIADWLSSDRPPLQTDMILTLEPFMKGRGELSYHLASVVIQSFWTFAIWLLLRAFRIRRVTAGTVIAGIYLTGFTIVNSFFVWPKLLAATYFIAFAILTLVSGPVTNRPNWLLRCVQAFLLACSLLSHGGSAFALAGILLYTLIRFTLITPIRRPTLRQICQVGLLTILFYSPWIAYQKFIDPPGDRLLKFHLANVETVTKETALKTIVGAYSNQSFSHFITAKQANIAIVFGYEREFLTNLAAGLVNPDAKRRIRVLQFFYFLPSLGLLGFGIAGLLLRWKKSQAPNEMRAAERLLLCSLCMIIPFILLMFRAYSTVLHQGTYASVLMAMAASILAFRAVLPRLALAVCALQCVFNWIVYAPDLRPAFPFSLTMRANYWMFALHLVSICGLLAALALNRQEVRRRFSG
jgi:hypothetical protein